MSLCLYSTPFGLIAKPRDSIRSLFGYSVPKPPNSVQCHRTETETRPELQLLSYSVLKLKLGRPSNGDTLESGMYMLYVDR